MYNQKKWSTYKMVGNLKIYLRRSMTTTEAINWLQEHCKMQNTEYFIGKTQVFWECK